MMEEGKKQEYLFTKRFIGGVKNAGCYLGDLATGEQTGMLFDKDYYLLLDGQTIKRTVMQSKDFSIDLRKKRDANEAWTRNIFRIESTGFIKDEQDMDEYSFSPGDDIEIRIKIIKDRIRVHLKYVGRSW